MGTTAAEHYIFEIKKKVVENFFVKFKSNQTKKTRRLSHGRCGSNTTQWPRWSHSDS